MKYLVASKVLQIDYPHRYGIRIPLTSVRNRYGIGIPLTSARTKHRQRVPDASKHRACESAEETDYHPLTITQKVKLSTAHTLSCACYRA